MLDGKRFLVIDEAQKIPDVGNALKLMIDSIERLTVLITMSSAFDVENHTGEPLTGRKTTFTLLGISEYACVQLFLEDLRPTGNRLD
jgi:predicted AAA+ superfamily ATPase